MPNLQGYVCLITGATRGIGRGIALGLGECGATVYITGRTLSPPKEGTSVGGSLEETVAEVKSRGGEAIGVVCDHSKESEVIQLFDRIRREQNGRLDLLVNNAYSAVGFFMSHMNQFYYEYTDVTPGEFWDLVNNVGLRNNYICSVLATRLMLTYAKQTQDQGAAATGSKRGGLIINISSVGGKASLFNVCYGVGKAGVDRMAKDMAAELTKAGNEANISVISLWPGAVQTEQVMSTVKDGADSKTRRIFVDLGESTELSGRAVAALLGEPMDKSLSRSGQIVLVADVADEYGIVDVNGNPPNNMRSLKVYLLQGGYWLGRIMPRWIRLPRWLFMSILESKSIM